MTIRKQGYSRSARQTRHHIVNNPGVTSGSTASFARLSRFSATDFWPVVGFLPGDFGYDNG